MRTAELKSGEIITYKPWDIPEIVSERFSEDIGNDINVVFTAYENSKTYETLKFNSDMESYETQLDEYYTELDDVANVLRSIICDEGKGKKMPKQKIIDTLERLEREIRSYL